MNNPGWLTSLGRSGCHTTPGSWWYRPHAAGSHRNVGPTSVSCFGEMASGKLPYSSGSRTGTHDTKFYSLPLTHKSSKHQHACAGRARQKVNGRRRSSLHPAQQGLLVSSPISGSKAGNRPVDVSPMGQVSYHTVSPLICSSDLSGAPKGPWDVNTKDANQLQWLGPGTMICQSLSDVTIPGRICVATGTQWQEFRSQAARLVL